MENEKSNVQLGRNKAVKAFRVFNGLTQQQISESLGLPKSFISEMENGKKPVTIQVIDRYAEYFKVQAWEIVYLGKVYDSKSKQSRFTKMLLTLIEWISDTEAPAALRLPLKSKSSGTPQRRASDNSPKRRITDFA